MKLTSFLFLTQITLACGSQNSNTLEIDPGNFADNKISLSEIADNITYIPLDNSLPIGITYSLRITYDHMYLSCKDVGILQFDRYGKMDHKIGKKGRGPGEYIYGMDFTVDEKNGNIYVLDPGKIKVYSHTGIFRRDLYYEKDIEYMGGDLEFYNSKLFIADYLITGNSKNNWVFLDTLGNLVAEKENSVPPFNPNMGIGGSIYKFGNKLFYYNLFNDTIFSISSDLSSKGAYLFAKGDHRMPRGRIETNAESWFKLFKPGTMFETKKFIVLVYSYLDRYAISLTDKKTGKIFLALKYEETAVGLVKSKPCLINDLDGGMPLSGEINYYSENSSEYLIQLINSFDLKVYLAGNEFKNTIPKYPEKKKELEKLANSLKETDNPVLMIVRLKK